MMRMMRIYVNAHLQFKTRPRFSPLAKVCQWGGLAPSCQTTGCLMRTPGPWVPRQPEKWIWYFHSSDKTSNPIGIRRCIVTALIVPRHSVEHHLADAVSQPIFGNIGPCFANQTTNNLSAKWFSTKRRKTLYLVHIQSPMFKTFQIRNLRMLVASQSGKSIVPRIIFVGKARSLFKSGVPEKYLNKSGRLRPCPQSLHQAGKAFQGQTHFHIGNNHT